MKFPKIRENSLFAILLRSPWWMSLVIAAGVFALARIWLPVAYAAAVPLPFMVIAVMAAVRQARVPSARQIAEGVESLRAAGWEDWSPALERAFRREGYEVARGTGRACDLELSRQGYVTLVNARRWKAARLGVEPLRELRAEADARDARGCIHVSLGEVSEAAAKFAREQGVRLIGAAELVAMLRRAGWRPAAAGK